MLITPTNLNLFFTALENRFWMAYGVADVWNPKIAQTLPVSSELWTSGWIGMVDQYRLWDGPRVVREPAPQTYTVVIQPFELTESIDQFKLQDDTYGIYNATIPFMGLQAKKLPDYQIRDLLQNAKAQTGVRQLGTDGLTHFSTAHPIDFYDASKGTYCNDFRGAAGFVVNTVNVGGAFTTTGFNTLWQEFASRKSESGEALGITPNLVMGPMQLKGAMMTVLQSQFFGPPQLNGLGTGAVGTPNAPFVGALDNPLKGWTDLLHNADLNGQPNTWYMMCTNGPMMPFNWLQREAPDFVPRIQPGDPVVFEQHKILYGSRARGAPAWGLPFLSAISNGGVA